MNKKWYDTSNHWSKGPNRDAIWARIKKKLKNRKPNAGSFKTGQVGWWRGKKVPAGSTRGHHTPHTQKSRKMMSEARAGKMIGVDNHKWVGDKVGKVALHSWVKRQLGFPQKCEYCGTEEKRMYHWANKSGEYKRDINDWLRLCVPCHKKYDLNK